MKITLINKELSKNNEVVYLTFKLDEKFNFKSWQFVLLDNWKFKKAYSIASSPDLLNENKISFYVKKASKEGMSAYLVENIKIDDKIDMTWPFWYMFVKEKSDKYTFLLISAWSWLWPILSIYENLINDWKYNKIYNFFQERYFDNIVENVYKKMIWLKKNNVKNLFYLSKDEYSLFKKWYITEEFLNTIQKIEDKDNIYSYICWKPDFVDDIKKILEENKVKNIYFEKY